MSPEVVAHRGASAALPEHTLAAYELAIAEGADALECDVRLTRDEQLVCVHDRTVSRTSDGRGAVGALTLAELRALDFGSWHGGDPAPVLTFAELAGLAADHGTALFVETKHPVRTGGLVEARLAEELARHSLDVRMMSFSALAVRRFKALAPTVPTVWLLDRLWPQRLPEWADLPGPGVSLLRRSPGRGRGAYCWTVDTAPDIDLCRERGVRYLATNHPARTRKILAADLAP
ncbi:MULTISPECIES: glycerophosphodiester phosphodiesterase [Actinosynnema]|uniref:Glycerophosphodiester phosphodiesterase n=1 Tax=Actinosynnema pretiosum TaxID=42197 RepID=A0A290YYV9_9PSEU|nr:glycerophosphodiester phosphodiesterase family protein [Actinosynnema pretiosum]ATE51935.1 glycerophosphodiester phosphodiesterase [Actinosynnema pretiosum]